MQITNTKWLGCFALGAALVSGACKSDIKDISESIKDSDAGATAESLAKRCGLDCPDEGIMDGNASISGVTSVDAFFGAVISYKHTANRVSSDIEAQLDAIKPDFGLPLSANLQTELDAQVAAYLDGGLSVEHEPAHCSVDVKTVVEAAASCDASIDRNDMMLGCKGTCEGMASAGATCEAGATAVCTTSAASVTCAGECKGECSETLSTASSCSGMCEGTCSGTCSAYAQDADGNFNCKGQCTGMCKGSCTSELTIGATCKGGCEGECSLTNAMTECTSTAKVSCRAEAGAMVMCAGRCHGDCQPPKAKAECEATAKVQSKLQLQCTPPRVVLSYKLAVVTGAKIAAQARFVAGLKKLEARLPSLLAVCEHAKSVNTAGDELVTSADGAVRASFKAAVKGKLSVKQTIGLGCAIAELDEVADVVSASSDRLNANLEAWASLQATLGIAD